MAGNPNQYTDLIETSWNVKKGTILNVFWIGERPTYKTKTLRNRGCRWANETEEVAGCYNENGEKVWIKVDYCQYVE